MLSAILAFLWPILKALFPLILENMQDTAEDGATDDTTREALLDSIRDHL